MKKTLFAILTGVLCLLAFAGCSMSELFSGGERKTYTKLAPQTGSNMPRLVETKEQKRMARAKRARTSKKPPAPWRERVAEEEQDEDEDFVARGGFR